MAKKLNLLVDTDVFIDYFNHQLFRELFENRANRIRYSVVTKKELLSKEGLSRAEKDKILSFLKTQCRIVPLDRPILQKYSKLREDHPVAAKEDCLIAATAIVKKFPLATRNVRHFRIFSELRFYQTLLSSI